MDTLGYGVDKMAWGTTRKMFGVCGNFKYEMITLTDVKATRSVIRPTIPSRVMFVASTNESDNKDVLAGQTLAWTGTADTNTPNELDDSGETFDPALYELFADNTASQLVARVIINASDATRCLCYKPDKSAVYDAFPAGTETFTIYNERAVQLIAATAGDDGTLLILG